MKKDTNTKTCPSIEVGDLGESLADAWLAFTKAPNDDWTLNELGKLLNVQIRKFLPMGRLPEPLKGLEEEAWQEAGLLLYSRFLAGNKALVSATRLGNRGLIAGQLKRSVSAALIYSRFKLRKQVTRHAAVLNAEQEWRGDGDCPHPAHRKHVGELTVSDQISLVVSALRRAVHEMRLDVARAELVRTLLENNLTQAELARTMGVSRQAINQRLNPVWRYLRKTIHDQEFPLS